MSKIAVVTGASSGLGREFVVQISEKYKTIDEIWVIARRTERLYALEREIEGKKVIVLPLDVTKQDDLESYKKMLAKEHPWVRVLVNAAGYGIMGHVEDVVCEELTGMIDVNCKALVAMTKITLPYMKEQSNLAPIVEAYTEYKASKQNIEDSLQMISEESDEELLEMAREELADSKKKVEELEKKLKILLLPKDPNDDKDIVVEIRAGAGGEEAALFAAELFRMYSHYADTKGWKIEVVNADETGIGGMKEVEFMVKGQGAYSVMKYESGVHRVQRVPVTESNGRIQTSTASVAVMPEAEEVDIQIDDKDIRIDVMRASGNGGQCVNTTDSAVRLTHYPTGIVIYSQTEKSQIQNKEKAFALLRAKLYDLETQKAHDAEADARRSQIGTGDRAEKIRTYNFPQGRVTDHRIGLTLYKLDKIMNGDIQEIIDACIAADQAKKLSNMEHDA